MKARGYKMIETSFSAKVQRVVYPCGEDEFFQLFVCSGKGETMKLILLLAVVFTLAFGSAAARMEGGNFVNSGIGANTENVEGVILNKQKASAKPGYRFQRESSKSVAVMKIIRGVAIRQVGTLTCTSDGGRTCEVFLNTNEAQCSGGCYFVGVRGAPRAQ